MRRRPPFPLAHLVGWPLVVLLLFAPGMERAPDPRRAARSPLHRLLGPVAELASNVQWVRFQKARFEGRHELAIARAESALDLAPEDPAGWELFASHLALNLSSAEGEPDPTRRLHWFQAGVEVTRRGEALVDVPSDLALLRAVFFMTKAEQDPDLPWPGGTRALLEEAARAYDEAATAYDAAADRESTTFARELAAAVRERLAE